MKSKVQYQSYYKPPVESPGFLLWEVNNVWQRKMHEALQHLNLTSFQFMILAGLKSLKLEEKKITQVEFASFIRSNVMMTSKVLRSLENRGYIARTESEIDSRAKLIELTVKGEEIAGQAIVIVRKMNAVLSDILGLNKQSFIDNLKEIAAQLEIK